MRLPGSTLEKSGVMIEWHHGGRCSLWDFDTLILKAYYVHVDFTAPKVIVRMIEGPEIAFEGQMAKSLIKHFQERYALQNEEAYK